MIVVLVDVNTRVRFLPHIKSHSIQRHQRLEFEKYGFLTKRIFISFSQSSESGKPKSPFATPEIEIDLDEVLDLDGDTERRKFITSLLTDVNKSPEVVNVSSRVISPFSCCPD